MSAAPLLPLGEFIEKVHTWNPANRPSDETFTYVDLGAVDQATKTIKSERVVRCGEAPSRARQLIKSGDVLVATVRPNLNAIARVPDRLDGATASTGFCILRTRNDQLDPEYVFQWVKTARFVNEMVRCATGASYPAVSDRIVADSKIPVPSLVEQRRIAKILNMADALQTQRRTALAHLDTLAQSIFLDMFGNPTTNPKSWPTTTLGDVVVDVTDGPHVSPNYTTDGIPFLSTRNVRPGEIMWDDLKFITEKDATIQWKKCKPVRGDILYTKGGTTGLAAAVTTDRPFAIWVHLALLKTDHEKVDSAWLEAMLNSRHCYLQSQELTRGIANRDLGLTRMVRIKFYKPPLNEQRRFAQRVKVIDIVRGASYCSLSRIDNLVASLQDRAFCGEF